MYLHRRGPCAVAGGPIITSAGLLAGLALAVAAVAFWRRRSWDGVQRLFWDLFALSQILWGIGEFGFMYGELVEGRPSWVRWHTMFSLCGGIGPLVAIIARPDRGVRKRATAAIAIDLASYGLLASFIYAYFVLVPSLLPATGEQVESVLLALVQTHRLLLVAGFAVGSGWLATARGATRTCASSPARPPDSGPAPHHESRDRQRSLLQRKRDDLAWVVPFFAYIWAAVEAPASPVESGETLGRSEAPSTALSAIPVLGIPLLGYGLLWLAPLGGREMRSGSS